MQLCVSLHQRRVNKPSHQSVINYDKLVDICQRAKDERRPLSHGEYMKEYRQIFLPSLSKRNKLKSSTEQITSTAMNELQMLQGAAIHSPLSLSVELMKIDSSLDDEQILKIRLSNITEIVRKRPPLRTADDVINLSSMLSYFPRFLPDKCDVILRETIAARVVAEVITDRKGIALPRLGGKYLILQGKVEEIQRDVTPALYTTKTLYPGEVFGEMNDAGYPLKLNYPIYIGEKRTILLRVTTSDVRRAQELVDEKVFKANMEILNCSPFLLTYPIHIRQKLAKCVQWKEIQPKTKVLQEGDAITSVHVIKDGLCKVLKSTSNAYSTINVRIGELRVGDCIGELVFGGCEIAPYTVVAITKLTVGEIPVKEISGLNVDKLQSPLRKYTISLPNEELLKELYAERQVVKQWESLKKSITGDIYRKRNKRL